MKRLICLSNCCGTALGMAGQASAACGTVSVAEMNWASAQLMANVDKIILIRYGCNGNCSRRYDANIYVYE